MLREGITSKTRSRCDSLWIKREAKPIIAITMGDAAGIGPEIIVKALLDENVWRICYPIVIGDLKVMNEACRIMGTDMRFKQVKDLSEAIFSAKEVDLLHPENLLIDGVSLGKVDPTMGQAAALCLRKAFELAVNGKSAV